MGYKPPLVKSDLQDGFNVRYLKLTGLLQTINHHRTTGKRNLFIKANVIAAIFWNGPYISSQFIGFFTIAVNIEKATFLTIHTLICLQVLSMLFVVWSRMDTISWLYDLAKKDFFRIPECKRPQVEKIFKKITKRTNMILLINLLSDAILMSLQIVDPVVPADYIASLTSSAAAGTGGKKKILGGWYPMPMDQSPYYDVIYAYEAGMVLYGGTAVTELICIFYQLLMCLYAQFIVLGYLLSTLKVDTVKRRSNVDHPNIDKEINKELFHILQDHQKILRYANELRSVYNPLVTVILGIRIFILVTSVFQFLFGGTGTTMFVIRSLQFLAYGAFEVCIFCFGSSSVEAASSDLQFAIYSSDWYKADVNFRKSAQMMMVRARRGVTLTAIKMYPVNVETIMAVFQFTYSTTTLMSRMSE